MSDLLRDLTAIQKKGGVEGAYRRCVVDSSNVITSSDSWHEIQYRIGSEYDNAIQEDNVYGEASELQATEEGNDSSSILLKWSAADLAFMIFMRDEVGAGKFFQLFLDWGRDVQNKYLEVFFPLIQISKNYKIVLPGRKPETKAFVLTNLTSFTPSTVPTWAHGVAANFATGSQKKYQPVAT